MKPDLLCASLLSVTATFTVHAQDERTEQSQAAANVLRPARVDATPERMGQLKVPAGFTVAPFATGLKNVRILAVGADGGVYVSRRDQGDVLLLRDSDSDGRADGEPRVVATRPGVHGLAIHDGRMYMATVKEIFVADILPDGALGEAEMIVADLPDGGQHPNRTLVFGPDGMLYVSVGSSCNACNETNPEHATLLRMTPDGKTRTIFASGLRNTIGFGWHPGTGELWGADHGIDMLGDNVQPEELNRIEQGKLYGWPHVYGEGQLNPQAAPPPGGLTREQWASVSTPMVLGYTAHAAPMQMAFHPGGGAFPTNVASDAFVAMRGSWNRVPASGYEVVRVDFEGGKPRRIEPFLTRFLVGNGQQHFGRPVGVAVAKDGSLLVGDDENGVIYRVASNGTHAALKPMSPPAGPMQVQAAKGIGVPIAMQRRETSTGTTLQVTSPVLRNNEPIAPKYSEYHDGLSPPISWTAVPSAKSYALIMEDPDAKPITPFVHWVAWNIPADVTSLPEGLQEQMRLTQPEGLMQGKTSRGSVGYYGPRPPMGDPPHHYHFLLLALDRMLDLPPGADRDQLLSAAKGHVIAKGELVGTYQQSTTPQK
jgi:Raf kinase inhibitor-like YbhB/YbcL family protein